MEKKQRLSSWYELLIACIDIGYQDENQIKERLSWRFGKGAGATRQYDEWYRFLERQRELDEKHELLAKWAAVWRTLKQKPPPIRFEWAVEEMKEHIERYGE